MGLDAEQGNVRERIADERAQLVLAVEELRQHLGQATDLRRMTERYTWGLAGGALLVGFLLAGGARGAVHIIALKERARRRERTRSRLSRLLA